MLAPNPLGFALCLGHKGCPTAQQQPVPSPIRHPVHSVCPLSQLLLTLGQSCRKLCIFCFNLLSWASCVVPGPSSFSLGIKLSATASFPPFSRAINHESLAWCGASGPRGRWHVGSVVTPCFGGGVCKRAGVGVCIHPQLISTPLLLQLSLLLGSLSFSLRASLSPGQSYPAWSCPAFASWTCKSFLH